MTDRIMIKGQTGGSFLAENPEAMGVISDVMPIATNRMLLAVGGYAPEDGMRPPTFTIGTSGVDGLYEGLYDSLLERTVTDESILRLIFGESEGRQTHTISRYCAALAEVLAYKILTEEGKYLSPEDCADLMSERLSQGIDSLRDVMRSMVGPRPGSERFFAVSLMACTLEMAGDDGYDVDVYAAGNFSLYMMHSGGMCPLWTTGSELVTGDGFGRVAYRRIKIHPEGSFSLMILPKSVCELSVSEHRNTGERMGMLWRHRMRLEEQLTRVLSVSLDTADAAERLNRHFEGHHAHSGGHGGESVALSGVSECVAGALLVRGGTYEGFRAVCAERLRQLEELIALFPHGYDAAEADKCQQDESAERDFILESFSTRAGCHDKAREALSSRVRELLKGGTEVSPDPWSDTGLRRLTFDDVNEVFEVFDSENKDDRAAFEANSRLLKGLLSEHWMTLRPILCRDAETPRAASSLEACRRLKKQLSAMTAYRRKCLARMETQLSDHLDVLRFQEQDWIHGRGGDDSSAGWFRDLETCLPALVAQTEQVWKETAERQRTLQSAYLKERDLLFETDIHNEAGEWPADYERILHGSLPREKWQNCIERAVEKSPALAEVVKMAETLSARNGRLKKRINERAAERKTMRRLSENEDWLVDCVRGALMGDEGWGACREMIDQGFRNEYKAFVRRLREEKELAARRKQAYATYHAMYTAYQDAEM